MPHTDSMLTHALAYAAKGWRVFPVHSMVAPGMCSCGNRPIKGKPHEDKNIGKHPYYNGWQVDASRDERGIKAWRSAWKKANIGMATGGGSGVIVVDIDFYHGGENGLAQLEKQYGRLPGTLEAVSGSGGRHLYFKHPGPYVGNKEAMAPGCDVRGDGGFIIVPPSNHRSGGEYEWKSLDWSSEIIAELPEAWVRFLTTQDRRRNDIQTEEVYVEEGGRNGYLFKIACGLRRNGLNREAINNSLLAINEEHCRPPMTADEVGQIADSAMRYDAVDIPISIQKDLPKERYRIHKIEDRRMVLRDAMRFLKQHDPPIVFQRGGQLVHVKSDAAPLRGQFKSAPGGSRIVTMRTAALLNALSEADWFKTDKSGEEFSCVPPDYLGDAITELPSWPFEPLHGLTAWPLLRRDGTLFNDRGYDKETGWYSDPTDNRPIVLPQKSEPALVCDAAVDTIMEAFCDFPLPTNDDKAALLSALLSPLLRHLYVGNTPLFAITAPTAGTGKTLLVDAASTILTGRVSTKRTCTKNEDEERKALFSINLSGEPIVLLDNVDHDIISGLLASMLTATSMTQRVLGGQPEAEALVTGTWFMTGNNLSIGGDNVRRVVRISMDSGEERPETRDGFKHPQLLPWIIQQRPHLLGALIALAQSYFASGSPKLPRHLESFGSFEGWSDLVRAIVWFAMQHDPLATRGEFTEGDEDRDALLLFMNAWYALFADQPRSVVHAFDEAELRGDEKAAQEFIVAACLFGRTPQKAGPDKRKVGNRIAKVKGRPVEGMKFVSIDKDRSGILWVLKRL